MKKVLSKLALILPTFLFVGCASGPKIFAVRVQNQSSETYSSVVVYLSKDDPGVLMGGTFAPGGRSESGGVERRLGEIARVSAIVRSKQLTIERAANQIPIARGVSSDGDFLLSVVITDEHLNTRWELIPFDWRQHEWPKKPEKPSQP